MHIKLPTDTAYGGDDTYSDDIGIAPRNLVAAGEEVADRIEELVDLCFHLLA